MRCGKCKGTAYGLPSLSRTMPGGSFAGGAGEGCDSGKSIAMFSESETAAGTQGGKKQNRKIRQTRISSFTITLANHGVRRKLQS